MAAEGQVRSDLAKLDAILADIGWKREHMECAIGLPIEERMSPETKRLIWLIITTPEARRVLSMYRLSYPETVITGIRRL